MMQHAGLQHSAAGIPHTAMPNPHLAASAMLSPTTAVTSANGVTSSQNLLVSNLGPFCSEQELKDLFNRSVQLMMSYIQFFLSVKILQYVHIYKCVPMYH